MSSIEFDGEWITITKKELLQRDWEVRIKAADVTETRLKPANWAFHGYIQFVLPGSPPAPELRGLQHGGRPPHTDPHSLSIPRRSNAAAAELVAAVEQARGVST
ncbi:DUF4429 domain-containing protein [Streptomyces sp. NPDC004838]